MPTKKKKENILHKEINLIPKSFKCLYFNLTYRIVFLAVLIIIFLSSTIMFLTKGLNTYTTHSIFYSEVGNVDYQVYLKPNTYFTEPFLPKDEQYVASLVDYINTDFKYNFSSSYPFDYKYKYKVTATLIATERGDSSKVVLKKNEILLPEKTVDKTNSNNFNITENLKIDYDKYNSIISAFKKDYALSIDSKVVIDMVVSVDGKYQLVDDPIISTKSLKLEIPLSEQTININLDYQKVGNYANNEQSSNLELVNYLYYGISLLCFIATIIFAIKLTKILNRLFFEKSVYVQTLNKIMRDYDRFIVTIHNLPNIDDKEIIKIKCFSELLDARENLQKPIMYHEIHKNQKGWFMILDDKHVYLYELKEVDIRGCHV